MAALLVFTVCFSCMPAQSKLLEGHVESVGSCDGAGGTNPIVNDGAGASLKSLTGGKGLFDGRSPLRMAHLRPPVGAKPAYQLPNSFPSAYEGLWHCATKVIDSAVASVPVGAELVSEVRFVRLPSGKVVAKWLQPGWTETQAKAVSWSPAEARVDRTSYYFGEGINGSWASRSRDQFAMVDRLRMSCRSYVDQYVDGAYIGRYRTISELTRVGPIKAIAEGCGTR